MMVVGCCAARQRLQGGKVVKKTVDTRATVISGIPSARILTHKPTHTQTQTETHTARRVGILIFLVCVVVLCVTSLLSPLYFPGSASRRIARVCCHTIHTYTHTHPHSLTLYGIMSVYSVSLHFHSEHRLAARASRLRTNAKLSATALRAPMRNGSFCLSVWW